MKQQYVNGLLIEEIENYSPLNEKADNYGFVREWVGYNEWGNAVVFGNTKKECIAEARKYNK